MEKKAIPAAEQEPATKRRKISQEPTSTSYVMHRLCKTVDVPPTNALGNIEDIIL